MARSLLAWLAICLVVCGISRAADVRIGPQRELLVDGKPFFPIFVWLQPIQNFDQLQALGINTFMGDGAKAEETAKDILDACAQRGVFGIVHFNEKNAELAKHPALLAWMFGDEPDLTRLVPYERPDIANQPGSVWIEGEEPAETTFPARSWMTQENNAALSQGKWLTVGEEQLPAAGFWSATYRFTVPAQGEYTLWVREFSKTWASPTRWRVDQGEWQVTPRSLKPATPGIRVARVLSVAWCNYGTLTLAPGEHSLELRVEQSRTAGSADKVTQNDYMLGVDAILLTVSKEVPQDITRYVPRKTPAEIKSEYEAIKQADKAHPVYLNLTAGFLPRSNRHPRSIYEQYAAATDMVGYDHYPIYGWGRPDLLYEVADATAILRDIAGPNRPVWAILETGKGSQWVSPERQRDPFPYEFRCEVWMAIINGATGIGYFPHSWVPKYDWCVISEEIRAEMKRVNAEIMQLAPVIFSAAPAEKLTVAASEGARIEAMLRREGQAFYVFSTNALQKPAQAEFSISPSPGDATVEVLGENRTLRMTDGKFADQFTEYATHLYRVVPQ